MKQKTCQTVKRAEGVTRHKCSCLSVNTFLSVHAFCEI